MVTFRSSAAMVAEKNKKTRSINSTQTSSANISSSNMSSKSKRFPYLNKTKFPSLLYPIILTPTLLMVYWYMYCSLSAGFAKFNPHGLTKFAKSSNARPLDCTRQQLLKERDQLTPSILALEKPYLQSSSITQKTKCPDSSNWLEEYYQELQATHVLSQDATPLPPFVGMSVGCNKGFDALNTLRMGTFNAGLSKSAWNDAITTGETLHESVCKQNSTLEFDLVVDQHANTRPGEIHCFEPMPRTVSKLKHAAANLGYDKMGYKVVHAGVGKTSGLAWFPSKSLVKAGVENVGMYSCDQEKGGSQCEKVNVFSLQNYVSNHVDGTGPIQILQIDVEGNDAEVLLGAGSDVLQRVEYLEFEYNFMGMWEEQHLYDIVEMLDQNEFTCYFSGVKRLWRITGCWMLYFDVHTWSNVACVNRKRVPRLASKMESIFLQTLEEEDQFDDAGAGRLAEKERLAKKERELKMDNKDHQILSTEPDVMSGKYV